MTELLSPDLPTVHPAATALWPGYGPPKPDSLPPQAPPPRRGRASTREQARRWIQGARPRPGALGRLAAPLPIAAITVLLLIAWAFLFEVGLSGLQEARAQHALYDQMRGSISASSTTLPALGGAIPPGMPVAILKVPRLGGGDMVAVEGTASSQLRNGPGHLPTTALPGQPGTSVIYGKSASFGAPFGRIGSLRGGDVITVTTGQGVFHYVVHQVRRPGSRTPVVSAASVLTLVSSEGTGLRSRWAPNSLVYVDAVLKGQPQPAPPGRPTALPRADAAMNSDTSGLVRLVLWLQATLVAVLGSFFLSRRWGRGQTWMVTLPVLLACLWGATENAALLLPNLV